MALKPLVINTKAIQAAGSEFIWNKLQTPEVFISSIVTSEVNIENSEDLDRLISGIPTPFARTAMFKYAINYVGQKEEEVSGLMAFYQTLQDEWKGLIACIALDNQPITIEKIILNYSDNKSKEDTRNIYEPKGAIGNMLFEDAPLWCDQTDLLDKTKKAHPFLYLIRYNGSIIGATSPESLVFTAPVYNINTSRGFYSQVTKKFTDPLKAQLSKEEFEKLFLYVKHLNSSINNYYNQFTLRKPEVNKISTFLNDWLSEIRTKSIARGFEIDENAIVPNLSKFRPPFDKLFNFQTTLYGYGGRISSDLSSLHLPDGLDAIEVELAELLLNPDTTTAAEIVFNDSKEPVNAGVHMLKAVSDTRDRYYTLPLSEKGLAIFQDEIEGLLNKGGGIKSYLSAIYDGAERTLNVTLEVDVNGNITSFTKKYKEPIKIEGQKVICWPDFVSKIWNKYYLYSELPHNAPEFKALPLRANKDNFSLLSEIKNGKYQFKKIAANGKKINNDDTAEILLEYDINKLGSTDLKYEIYESTEPFKAIEFQFKNKASGYLVFKSITSDNKNTLKDYRSLKTNLNGVRVGFDFGSNNTCISYATQLSQPELITFKNRRKFLLGVDIGNDSKLAATPNEVFFFQNEETQSNRVKSMVMIHDERRIKDIEKDANVILKKEVRGGFPVFETNIPVEHSDDNTHTIQFVNQPSRIKFNMKWSSNEKENAYKQGLLKTLWLKTYAELFEKDLYPESLVWAYPSSMNTQIINKYRILWNEIGQLNPLVGKNPAVVAEPNNIGKNKNDDDWGNGNDNWNDDSDDNNTSKKSNDTIAAQTEAESVCRHALGIGLNPGTRGLLMGFDVGGSTTDILCVALNKNSEGRPVNTLIKQSSIKFAAGKLADATKKSKKFQEVLTTYCRKKDFLIHGITVAPVKLNSSTSSFYYNAIVDRLHTQNDLYEFYRNIAADCPELFVLNAYMTGLILFYSGQLAYKIKLSSHENPDYHPEFFEEVRIGIFGKGGRMFDWLRAVNEQAAMTYYKTCFGEGYGVKVKDHIKKFSIKSPDPEYVKAEVSFGLSRRDKLESNGNKIREIIGEEGYTYNGAFIDSLDNMEPKFLKDFGTELSYPREFKNFSEFIKKFHSFSKEFFAFNMPNLQQEINDMPLASYVNNIPEYILARDSDDFDFEAPIIILEGMCFLDTVLMQKMFG